MRARMAAVDWAYHIPWEMLGIRSTFREGSNFSPTEVTYGSQLILPGQFTDAAESPAPSFLADLQTAMSGMPPFATHHNTVPVLPAQSEELLLPVLSWSGKMAPKCHSPPLYDGP